MNCTHILAQPAYFYTDTKDIQANQKKEPVLLEEVVELADEIEKICEVDHMEPFKYLIKAVEKEVDGFSVYGYYLVGNFDLDALKTAISKGLVTKRWAHIAFSDKPIPPNMEQVALSYDDTRILVEWNRNTKFINRKEK